MNEETGEPAAGDPAAADAAVRDGAGPAVPPGASPPETPAAGTAPTDPSASEPGWRDGAGDAARLDDPAIVAEPSLAHAPSGMAGILPPPRPLARADGAADRTADRAADWAADRAADGAMSVLFDAPAEPDGAQAQPAPAGGDAALVEAAEPTPIAPSAPAAKGPPSDAAAAPRLVAPARPVATRGSVMFADDPPSTDEISAPGMPGALGAPGAPGAPGASRATQASGALLREKPRADAAAAARARARQRAAAGATALADGGAGDGSSGAKNGGNGGGPRQPPSSQSSSGGRSGRSRGLGALAELAAVAVSVGLVGLIAFLYAAFVVVAPRPADGADLWNVNRLPSIVIVDMNGEELAARGARYGQQVAVDELPPYLVKAIVATEDRRFFEHGGVDLRGLARAMVVNLRSGRVVEGGSTITQQLARNLFLSANQTYTRKAREALLAIWIEGRYSKEQILSLYLNRIYFGAGAYGIDSAARTYFGKSAREVTLSEAVLLAGLPKAPSQLAPTLNPGGAQSRAKVVLDNLREIGAISEFEAREALLKPAVVVAGEGEADLGWFFDYVAEKARGLAGPRGDLVITTTLDRRLQRAAVAAVRSGLGAEARLNGAAQAALVAYDVNGALRAMVGGRSYLESQFNRATQARRQPGSAFKPFVFAAALEAGLRPDSIFVDQPINIDGWQPENYTPGFAGRMRLTEAVARSINTIAVQVSEQIGRDRTVEMARRLGVKSDLPAVASIALGGVSLTLEELAAAYIPFADEGLAPTPHAIERIEDRNYEVIYQRPRETPRRVLDAETAEGMTHLLYQVLHSGTGAAARLGARDAAGKTGTTNDWRDAWFIGYTRQYVAGVWVGNDDFTPMDRITGGGPPAAIWREFMLAAHQDLPRLPLKGAYPASTVTDESELLAFYSDLSEALRAVRRDGGGGLFDRRDRRRGRDRNRDWNDDAEDARENE